MNSALSHNLDLAIRRSAPAFKINADEVSRRLLAVLFPTPTVTMPMAPPTVPTVPSVPVPAPKPAVKPTVSEAPMITFTPTLSKKWTEIAKEFKIDPDEGRKEFLAYVRDMSMTEYSAKTPQAHMREFLKPKPQQPQMPSNAAAACASITAPPPKPEMVEINENCVQVLYKGREYWVGEDSKRVYQTSVEGVDDFVGMMGLAEFDGMEMPVDEV
jgi:hypothetical protein